MYCEVNRILCQDFSGDLTLRHNTAKHWRMPITHWLAYIILYWGNFIGQMFLYMYFYCYLYIIVFWDYSRMIFFLVVNKWIMLYIFCYWTLCMPDKCWTIELYPKPIVIKFCPNIFDTSHSLEQHGTSLWQDGDLYSSFFILLSLSALQISLGAAGSLTWVGNVESLFSC